MLNKKKYYGMQGQILMQVNLFVLKDYGDFHSIFPNRREGKLYWRI